MKEFAEFFPFLLPLIIAQFALMGYSVYHVLTHENYKRGSRPLWLVLSIVLSFFGPILYFIFGKEDT